MVRVVVDRCDRGLMIAWAGSQARAGRSTRCARPADAPVQPSPIAWSAGRGRRVRVASPRSHDSSERLPGQQRRSLAPRREEETLDGDESCGVADIAGVLRDEDRMLVVELDG
jgi:hypothetical protein